LVAGGGRERWLVSEALPHHRRGDAVDAEHLDYYRDLAHIQTRSSSSSQGPFYGMAVLCLDQENIQALLPRVEKRYVTYGLRSQADFLARDVSFAA